MTALVLRGDARQLPLPDKSVDLIVTSPPYFGLRSYQDGGEHYAGQIGAEATPREFIGALLECTREWMRVLQPEGSLWVNLGDKYAQNPGQFGPQGASGQRANRSQAATYVDAPARQTIEYGVRAKSLTGIPWRYALGCIDDLGLILRAEVIWDKPNPLPENVVDRVRRSHEQWFHFVREPHHFSACDEIREPYVEPNGRPAYGRLRPTLPGGTRGANVGRLPHAATRDMGQHSLGRIPGSVWTFASQPLKVPVELEADHYAAFPPAMVRRIVLGWSPDGGTVLDPFGGSGTTALVASAHGRRGVTVDRSADYCRIAAWRTKDRGERARARGLPKPAPVPAGQDALFEEPAS